MKNSHTELGLGLGTLFDKQGYGIEVSNTSIPHAGNEKPSRLNHTTITPAANIGYRYQKPSGGFVFRTGIGFPDGVYLSLGFAF